MFKVFLFLIFGSLLLGKSIEHYDVLAKQYTQDHEHYLVSRTFIRDNTRYYLLTNTATLNSKIMPLDDSMLMPLDATFENTLLAKALKKATALHEQGGISHAIRMHPKALYLTIDMCPSHHRDYESTFFEKLASLNQKMPVAIAISSGWILHHQQAFESLKNNPNLLITWVNHTHTHFYDPMLPPNENFMLRTNTNVKKEILGVEKLLIENGETPSVFFRFPGLMANKSLMKALREVYFLVPLGADAWIAKNQTIKEGSFILVHGNKNEPLGIKLLEKKLPELMKKYSFSPIQEAFRE